MLPLSGLLWMVWYGDKDGYYSEYGGNDMPSTDFQRDDFLRGRTANNRCQWRGLIHDRFSRLVFSGCAPHMHVHVYRATGKSLLVTQIAFPYDMTITIYTTGQAQGYTKEA